MGNKSCYSNTRRNHPSNRINLTNTSQHQSHQTQYHIFHDKSSEPYERRVQIPSIDLFLTPYYNIEILSDNLNNEQECGICFEYFRQKDIVARLECLCIYHKQCLDEWNQRKRSCPLHMDEMILNNRNKSK